MKSKIILILAAVVLASCTSIPKSSEPISTWHPLSPRAPSAIDGRDSEFFAYVLNLRGMNVAKNMIQMTEPTTPLSVIGTFNDAQEELAVRMGADRMLVYNRYIRFQYQGRAIVCYTDFGYAQKMRPNERFVGLEKCTDPRLNQSNFIDIGSGRITEGSYAIVPLPQ